MLRRCYVPKPGIVHITRGTSPPGTHSGIKGLHYAILGNFNPAVSRMVFKCYGGLVIAALRSQSRCFSVLPDMPANTGTGSRLKDDRITIAGGASLCIVWHGAPASIWLRCSLLVICAGSKMCTVWVSPPPLVEGPAQKGLQPQCLPGCRSGCRSLGQAFSMCQPRIFHCAGCLTSYCLRNMSISQKPWAQKGVRRGGQWC